MSTDEIAGTKGAEESLANEIEHSADLDADELLVGRGSDHSPVLSVVMPTLNEEDGVAECIARIKTAVEELGVRTEIIVSDSSTDRTPEIARQLGAIVVSPDEPGYGYAYRFGFDHVRGDYIAMGDADTTYDFEQIPRLLEPILEGDADIVMGNRLDGEIRDGAMPTLHQYVGNPLLTKFLNGFYDAGIGDAHSGFRVFTRQALDRMELKTDGMEFASEMVMDASARGLRIEEVPIVYHEREGEETLDSFQDGWRHIRFMLLNAPGYLFSVPGMAFGALGLVLSSLAMSGISVGGASFGVRTMIAGSLLIFVGFQVTTFGLFSRAASDPIRQSDDRLSVIVNDHLTLERGAAIGFGLIVLGVGYVGLRVTRWVTQGYGSLSSVVPDIFGLTICVLGLQFLFTVFFLSTVGESSSHFEL